MTRRLRTSRAVAVAAAGFLLVGLAGCADPNAPAGASDTASGDAAPTVTVTETQTQSSDEPPESPSTPADPTADAPTEAPSGSGLDSPNLEKALESAMETYLEFRIGQVLADNGVKPSKGPNCNADLSRKPGSISAAGKVSCSGTTTKGQKVVATFTGSATAGAGCDGTLVVKVGGKTVSKGTINDCIVEVA